MKITALLTSNHADLPDAGTQRWMAWKKARVLAAIQTGALSLEEACRRYVLTAEEVQTWHESFAADGVDGLKMRRLAERRTSARRKVSEPATAVLDSKDQLECVITDIGGQGARLEFRVRLPVPRQFQLYCRRSARSLPVSVKWQRDQCAGVLFDASASDKRAGIDDLGSWLLGET